MISIVLMSIIILFLYKILSNQTIFSSIVENKISLMNYKNKIFNLFYRDINGAKWIKISPSLNKNFDIVYLLTQNSLHEIPLAYVVYYINVKDRTLVRLESREKISFPVSFDKIPLIFVDIIGKDIKKFRFFLSKNGDKILLFLKSSKVELLTEF